MLKKYFYFFGVVVLFALTTRAWAMLDLELTQGVDSAIPIAIVPFQSPIPVSVDLTEVIAQDLYHSGEFKPLPKTQIDLKPSRVEEVERDFWQKKGMDYVVVGHLEKQQDGRYQVTASLVDVYQSTSDSRPTSSGVLLTKIYRVPESALRQLAHRISDEIYEKLIGVKGIFSTKIAYVLEKRGLGRKATYSLMIADSDGYAPRPILVSEEPIMSPAWTPDGRKLAYVSFEKVRASIYLSDLATGKRQLLTQYPGINGAPAFAPRGYSMALVLSKTGNPEIYSMNLWPKQLQLLTEGWSIDTEPAWSPDGKQLLFTSDRGGNPQVYLLNLSTREVQRVTYQGNYNAKASFTPDGKQIVMLHRESRDFNIAVQDLESGTLSVLSHATDDQSPSISPNGKMVIYASYERGRGLLNMVSLDGRVKLKFPESNGSVREPVWQPFVK